MTATTNPPSPAQDPAETLATWLRGLGFDQLDGGWFHRANVRVHLTGTRVNLFVAANGTPGWVARTEDAPRTVLVALLGLAGINSKQAGQR